MHKLAKAGIMREVKDYAYITLGLISYSLGWGILTALSDNDRRNYRYQCYHLLLNRIPYPMVIFHYQRRSDDICYPDIRPAIQYKNDICYLYADFPALVVPTTGQQLCGSTGHDSRR